MSVERTVYKVVIAQKSVGAKFNPDFEIYKFKDLGYMQLLYLSEREEADGNSWNWHGLVTIDELIERIGKDEFENFLNGKRRFVCPK